MTIASPAFTDIIYEKRDDGVAVITLNRPQQMNALGGQLVPEFIAACGLAQEDDDVRAVVVTGAGRGFCAGADLSAGGPGAGEGNRAARLDRMGFPAQFQLALARLDKPVIGAINGVAAGAGLGVALALDVRIAADTARFTTVFIKRGLAPDFATSYYLPRLIGLARSYELFYTGRFVDAQEALSLGIVNKIVPAASLMDETLAFAAEIAAGPPMAMTFTRRALQRSFESTLEEALRFEWTQQLECLRSEDAREGIRAWQEKRAPRFTGR
jgi:2-(1,2-epoxy-1,2-dihydrophenyl)acetyl-CoA isomerase